MSHPSVDDIRQLPRATTVAEDVPGLVPSHGVSINLPGADHARPHPVKFMCDAIEVSHSVVDRPAHATSCRSAPTYQSPIRHHRRAPSRTKAVKETLDARSHYGSSEDDHGGGIHRINQYTIKQEIGRGSFGAVHLAEDQYGNEYAVKEFSKSRLRKRAQSNLLRNPQSGRRPGPGHLAARMSFNSPLHRHSASEIDSGPNNSLSLIKEEIAIMKKLDHPNVVSLIEVLDDPDEDSLYMVLEMCKKGVVMKVGLDEKAEPYGDEACRCWFRDMILGIEYLHAQGIIHRDLKPDNCLVTKDDVLKIVDFGVSEMFNKQSDMSTTKSAGSPAFMPPELCVARHGPVSGRAADIWSMGVTLYCLRYGHIPFETSNMLDLYKAIRNDEVPLHEEHDQTFKDLMLRILEKDPEKRITMQELREHPWVTKNGTDNLLSMEENCAELVEPPTETEMNHAITGNMGGVMVVMKAVRRFKELIQRKRPLMMEGIFGREARLVAPPQSVQLHTSHSVETFDRQPFESTLMVEGVHCDVDVSDVMDRASAEFERMKVDKSKDEDDDHLELARAITEQRAHAARAASVPSSQQRYFSVDDHLKGHAHDPLSDTLYLKIGTGEETASVTSDEIHPIVSESPSGVEENIYEQAYQQEVHRIMKDRGDKAALHLTRQVEHNEEFRSHPNMLASSLVKVKSSASKVGGFAARFGEASAENLAALVKEAQARADKILHERGLSGHGADGADDASSNREYFSSLKPDHDSTPITPLTAVTEHLPGAFPHTPNS